MRAMGLLLLLGIGLSVALPCFGQGISRRYVQEQVRICHPEARLNSATLYILDGILLQEKDLYGEGVQPGLSIEKIFRIEYLGPDAHKLPHRPRAGIVLISTLRQQKKKVLRKELEAVKLLFDQRAYTSNPISEDSRDPVLILDGKVIFHADAPRLLAALRPGELMAINHYACAYPVEMWGQNARNGLVQIWRK